MIDQQVLGHARVRHQHRRRRPLRALPRLGRGRPQGRRPAGRRRPRQRGGGVPPDVAARPGSRHLWLNRAMLAHRQRRPRAGRGGDGPRSPTRACCAATASSRSCASTAAGPYALDEHLARMARSAANLRLPFDVDAVRADARALLEAAEARPTRMLRMVVTRGGRRIALVEPLPDAPRDARAGHVTYAPTRLLDGIKSLSYGANMLATRLAKEHGRRRGAARHAARPRARGADAHARSALARRRDARHAAARRPRPRLDHPPRRCIELVAGRRAPDHARRAARRRRRRSSPRRRARCRPSARRRRRAARGPGPADARSAARRFDEPPSRARWPGSPA